MRGTLKRFVRFKLVSRPSAQRIIGQTYVMIEAVNTFRTDE
jgi:hypothetical protein